MKESFEKIGSEGKPEIPKEEIFVDEIFDPEEEMAYIKEEIKKAPKEEQSGLRKKLISEFKEKLIWQRKGIADLKDRLENFIEKNPDEPKEKFLEIVEKRKRKWSLSQGQVKKFERVIDRYLKNHKLIQESIKEYQERFGLNWQRELFKDLAGNYQKGNTKLEISPTCLVFYCDNLNDFRQLSGSKDLLFFLNQAFFRHKTKFGPIAGINLWFIKSRAEYQNREAEARRSKVHEVQHAIYNLEKTILSKTKLGFFQKLKNLGEEKIKDEILSYLKEEREWEKVRDFSYENYILQVTKYIQKKRQKRFEKILNQLFKQLAKEIQEEYASPEEWFKERTEKEQLFQECLFNKAILAAEQISQIPPYQNRNKLVDLLSLEPLAKWSRLLRLLRETEI